MAYVPQNLQIFTAAFCGALAGMGLSDRIISDQSSASYAGLASVAGAFAQAVDTAWTSARATTLLDVEAVQSESAAYWQDRSPIPDATNTAPATHAAGALALIATITAGNTYFTAQGITPPPIPGGGSTGGGNYVANGTALAAVAVGALQTGVQYYVGTFQQYFVWSPTSTDTPNGTTIIAPTVGTGRWLRNFNYTNPAWLSVANWYIDATNGNDENNGQQQAPGAVGSYLGPLKTHAELERRWGNRSILTPPLDAVRVTSRICRVYILTDLPTTDPINFNISIPENTFLWYTGELGRTVLYTGTIATFTAVNAATNQAFQFSDAGLNPTTYLNKRCRCTTAGTNNNAIWYIAKDLGANTARMSTPGTPQPMTASGSLTNIGYNQRVLVAGDTYVIENIPTVTFAVTNINTTQPAALLVGELSARFNWTVPALSSLSSRSFEVYASSLNGASIYPACVLMNNFITNSLYILSTQFTYLEGGLIDQNGAQNFGGVCFTVFAPLIQGGALIGTGWRIVSLGIFDCPVNASRSPSGHAVSVGNQQTVSRPNTGYVSISTSPLGADTAAQSLFGNGNAGVGVFVPGGSKFTYPTGSVLAVTGTGGDFKLDNGTTSNVWDQTAAAGAGAWLVPRNNTWANLAAAVGAAGFGGNAHNVASDAHLVLQATG